MGIIAWTAQAMGEPLFGFCLVVALLVLALWPQRREPEPPPDPDLRFGERPRKAE